MTIHTEQSKRLINPTIIIPSIFLLLTVISALTLTKSPSSTKVSATEDRKSAIASVTVPDTCYMSSTSYNHTGTINGGSYTENFGGESTVTVTCNDRNGYSVYAVGYSNDIEGTNGLIGTSTGLVIPSGTSTSTNVSNWAMKLTPGTGTFAPTILSDANGSFANYHVVPATATKVVTYTSDIDVSTSSQFKTSYAVAIAPNQPADTYVGKVKYTVVHPNYSNVDGTRETYNIPVTFAGQGVSSVTFTATGYPTRTVSTSGGTANLAAGVAYTMTATFTSGYELVSWAINNTSYGTISSTSINSTIFTPKSASATITVTGKVMPILAYNMNGGSGSISSQACSTCTTSNTMPSYRNASYASFKNWNTKADGTGTSYNKNASITLTSDTTLYAQWDFTSNTLQSTTYSSGCSGTKHDARDGNSYTVAQIVGLCWMTKNLDLHGGTTLYSGDTNVPDGYYTTTPGFVNGNTLPASSASFGGENNYAYVYNSGSTTCTSSSPCYSYYSWPAVKAGYDTRLNETPLNYDICPKGWRLPTTAEYNSLISNYNTAAALAGSPFLGAYSGDKAGSFYYDGGNVGYYWTSAHSTNLWYKASALYFNAGNGQAYIDSVAPWKANGFAARCVAQS